MKRDFSAWVLLLGACLIAIAPMVSALPAEAQIGFDRPGGDYARAPVTTGDPADCALVCERDRRCRAWSFTYPPNPQANAACWLKNTLPTRIPSNCCVSGVRGAGVLEPRSDAMETFIDRVGGDYRSFEIAGNGGDADCKAACTGDARCRAWTYARAGYVGRDARCFLKQEITAPHRRPGFSSGVVR